VQFSFNGVTVGGTEAYDRLEKMQETHELLTYMGKFRIEDLVITSLQRTDSKDNDEGCSFSVTFQKVQIGSSEFMKAGELPLMSGMDASKPKAAPGSQTSATKNEGLKTKDTTKLSDTAYLDYVNTYNAKPVSSPGAGVQPNPATSGIS
jgi:hypothetical protein